MELTKIKKKLKNLFTRLLSFLGKYWSFLIYLALIIIFISVGRKSKLIVGSTLIIFIAFKEFFIQSIKRKDHLGIFFSILMFFLGILAFMVRFLLPLRLDIFIFFFLLFLFLVLIAYLSIEKKQNLRVRSVAILLIGIVGVTLIFTLGNIILDIHNNGFSTLLSYLSVIIFCCSIVITIYLIIKFLIETFFIIFLKKVYYNWYLYLSLAVGTFILMGGYLYLKLISDKDLRDFLIIISWAFFISLTGISALKNIIKKRTSNS